MDASSFEVETASPATSLNIARPASSRRNLGTGWVKAVLSIAYFSWAGMALRLGLSVLTEGFHFGLTTSTAMQSWYCIQTTEASGYFLQNMIGCFLIAIVARHKLLMNEHIATGLSTGLCGSLTTWTTWMQQEAFTMVHGEVWMAFVSLVCMLSVCFFMFSLGEIAANGGMDVPVAIPLRREAQLRGLGGLRRSRSRVSTAYHTGDEEASVATEASMVTAFQGDWTLDLCPDPPEPASSVQENGTRVLDRLLLGVGAVIILVALGLIVSLRHVPSMVVFAMAPFGSLVRWLYALGNPLTAPLPVFTLVANTLGCGIAAFCTVLAGRAVGGFEHDIWTGLGMGFGGCLSTVSTFIVELRTDKLGGFRMRAAYFFVSFGLAMAVLLPVSSSISC